MNPKLEMLSGFQLLSKLYERQFKEVRKKYKITQLEIDILAFLKNNPRLDTASDIIRYRMLPKANVSQAVELLIQKNLIKRNPDKQDRRKIHLTLLETAQPLLSEILAEQNVFWEVIFDGIPESEREWYMHINHQVARNVTNGLTGNLGKQEEDNGTEK